MKYEVSRSNTFRVIALQGSVDRRTDGQTDNVITIGLPHLRWRGPNKYRSAVKCGTAGKRKCGKVRYCGVKGYAIKCGTAGQGVKGWYNNYFWGWPCTKWVSQQLFLILSQYGPFALPQHHISWNLKAVDQPILLTHVSHVLCSESFLL